MRLDFRRVPEAVLIKGMADICAKRSIDVSEDALRIIAANADGSVRDGLSILDQCIAGGENIVGAKDVLEFLGASGEETFTELTELVRKGKTADALVLTDHALSDGKDVRQFMRDWVNHYRNLLMAKFIRDPQDVINMSVENIGRIRKQSASIELADINCGILELSRTMREAKWSTQPRILLELAVVNLSSNLRSAAPAGIPDTARRASDAEIETGAELYKKKSADETSGAATQEMSGNGDDRDQAEKFDLDELWKAVFEDGEAAKGSFYIIGSGGHLTSVGEYDFTVVADSEPVKRHAEKNRELLESLLEKHTGKRRTMNIMLAGNEVLASGMSVENMAREAESVLGINVEIK